jgi:hypothetical protein
LELDIAWRLDCGCKKAKLVGHIASGRENYTLRSDGGLTVNIRSQKPMSEWPAIWWNYQGICNVSTIELQTSFELTMSLTSDCGVPNSASSRGQDQSGEQPVPEYQLLTELLPNSMTRYFAS